jgi:hypothetical protein
MPFSVHLAFLLPVRSATIPEMPDDLARHRSLLTTASVASLLPETVPEARMLRAWLET